MCVCFVLNKLMKLNPQALARLEKSIEEIKELVAEQPESQETQNEQENETVEE